MLTKTVGSFEPVFKKQLRESAFHYHPLFEKFQSEVLLPDAETGEAKDASLDGGSPISCPAEEMPDADSLFLLHFINNLTERPEEINLTGINQLPVLQKE